MEKETLKTLGLVKRFDENWSVVEKPTEPDYSCHPSDYDYAEEYQNKLEAYNNAKEYAYMPPMVGFVDHVEDLPKDSKTKWGATVYFKSTVKQPLTLDQFIPAVEVNGVWKVLSEPKKWSDWLDFQRIVKTGELTMHPFTTLDMKEFEQYQKSLDKVKYEGWEVVLWDNDYVRIKCKYHDFSMTFRQKGYTGILSSDEVTYNNEHLINELSKHGVCLILKR